MLISGQIYVLTIYVYIGVVNSGRHDSPQTAPPEGNASSTLTSCLHCVITAPPQPHDARPYDQPRHALQDQCHPPSVQVPRRRLHAAQRRRVIDSPALDGNELCAAPSYLRCALALPSPAPFRLAGHPRSLTLNLHPSALDLTLRPRRRRGARRPAKCRHPRTNAIASKKTPKKAPRNARSRTARTQSPGRSARTSARRTPRRRSRGARRRAATHPESTFGARRSCACVTETESMATVYPSPHSPP